MDSSSQETREIVPYLARWLQINGTRPDWVLSVERQLAEAHRKGKTIIGVTFAGIVFSSRHPEGADYLREALRSMWERLDLRGRGSVC